MLEQKPQSFTQRLITATLDKELYFPQNLTSSIRALISGRIKETHPGHLFETEVKEVELPEMEGSEITIPVNVLVVKRVK